MGGQPTTENPPKRYYMKIKLYTKLNGKEIALYTSEEFAKKLGVSRMALKLINKRDPKRYKYFKIANIYLYYEE